MVRGNGDNWRYLFLPCYSERLDHACLLNYSAVVFYTSMSRKVECPGLALSAFVEVTVRHNDLVFFGLRLCQNLSFWVNDTAASYQTVLAVIQSTPCSTNGESSVHVAVGLHHQSVMEQCVLLCGLS